MERHPLPSGDQADRRRTNDESGELGGHSFCDRKTLEPIRKDGSGPAIYCKVKLVGVETTVYLVPALMVNVIVIVWLPLNKSVAVASNALVGRWVVHGVTLSGGGAAEHVVARGAVEVNLNVHIAQTLDIAEGIQSRPAAGDLAVAA